MINMIIISNEKIVAEILSYFLSLKNNDFFFSENKELYLSVRNKKTYDKIIRKIRNKDKKYQVKSFVKAVSTRIEKES